MWCAFSISTNTGSGIIALRNRLTVSCNFGRRFFSASISTSGVIGIVTSEAIAISGSHGSRSGIRAATAARMRSATMASESSRATCSNSRSTSRHTTYGVEAV